MCLLRTCSARTAPNELKTSPKLHQIMFYKIMKKRNHLIVLRALLLLQSVISISFWPPFIGNPNFQDILNWILQILHYYCRKQHKNIKNSRIIEQNLVLSFPFSLFTATCASCRLPQRQNFFISWTKYFANFKRHKWSFVLYIVSFSGLKMIFTKFSQLDITACIKNCVYNNFNLCCYFMSSIIERLQISLL